MTEAPAPRFGSLSQSKMSIHRSTRAVSARWTGTLRVRRRSLGRCCSAARTSCSTAASTWPSGTRETRIAIPAETRWTPVSNLTCLSGERNSTTIPRAPSRAATSAAKSGSPPAVLSTTISVSATVSISAGYPRASLPDSNRRVSACVQVVTDERSIRHTRRMAMSTVDLQRRRAGHRADELLEQLQNSLAEDRRVRWNDSGHARIALGRERDDAREYVADRLLEIGDDWADHIAVL